MLGLAAELVLAALLTWALFPSFWVLVNAVFDEEQTAGPNRGIVLSEVADNPDAMWGRTVTISATVHERIDANTMRIGDPEKPFVGDEVLIVADRPLEDLLDRPDQAPIEEGEVVQVTGTVRRFDLASLEADLGIDLDETSLAEYRTPSALVAQAIFVGPPFAVGPGDKEFGGTSAGWELGTPVGRILRNPDWYLGRSVIVSGEIEAVFGAHAIVVRDDGILVLSAQPRHDLFVEPTAYVRGEVRRFDLPALEDELGIDLDEAALEPFAGQTVTVADEIRLVT